MYIVYCLLVAILQIALLWVRIYEIDYRIAIEHDRMSIHKKGVTICDVTPQTGGGSAGLFVQYLPNYFLR